VVGKIVAVALGFAVVGLAACGGNGGASGQITKQDLNDAKSAAYTSGYKRGEDRARRYAATEVRAAREEGFQRGVRYVMGPFHPDLHQVYAIDFQQRDQGLQIDSWLAMKDDRTYQCPSYRNTCTNSSVSGSGGTGGSGGDGCDPSYPDQCLDPNAIDYDCEGGGGDGPQYVTGPLTVLPPDPFGLDSDGDGTGCVGDY
jgi:hypothetical protein